MNDSFYVNGKTVDTLLTNAIKLCSLNIQPSPLNTPHGEATRGGHLNEMRCLCVIFAKITLSVSGHTDINKPILKGTVHPKI